MEGRGPMSEQMPAKFRITWSDGRYFVSIPNYEGGEVVRSDIAERMAEALKPFAQLADICDHFGHDDSKRICRVTIKGVPQLVASAGECRAARSALSAFRSTTQGTEAR
jgi:hypothetical protein